MKLNPSSWSKDWISYLNIRRTWRKIKAKVIPDDLDTKKSLSIWLKNLKAHYSKLWRYWTSSIWRFISTYKQASQNKRIEINSKLDIIRCKIWKNWSAYQISKSFGVSISSVHSIVKEYNVRGIRSILNCIQESILWFK